MKISINCFYCHHKNREGILLQFPLHTGLNNFFKKLPFAKYSNTHKGWIIPKNKAYLQQIATYAKPIANLNITALKGNKLQAELFNHKGIKLTSISMVNTQYYQQFKKHLTNSGYSHSTIKTYTSELATFFTTLQNIDASLMTVNKLTSYFYYCHTHLKLSENTLHSRINALKYFYENVLRFEKFFYEIPRPKKKKILPKVISEEKILEYILKVSNLKHKTILLLAYSAGLRVSEVINLKISDIDSNRMQVCINAAKGKKDRRVPLSKSVLQFLREYYKEYKPIYWLFEGQLKGEKYHTRTAQLIFKQTYKYANLPSSISFHSLRHSYATHLLDNGTDIKYIQQLLGHNDIKTTLRYLHVTNKDLAKIESPLDKILRKHNTNLSLS